MGAPAIVALVIGTAISAYASIQEGRSISSAENFRQDQIKKQMTQQDLQTRDELNERRRAIAAELGEQAAEGASSGFDAFGAGSSFLAIREETERVGAVDQQRVRLIGSGEQSVFSGQLTQSKMVASNAKSASFLKAAGTVAGGAFQATQVS
jgi:hypothetical protein